MQSSAPPALIEPPADWEPRDLFELLCEWRPSLPFAWCGQSLHARALTPIEWAAVRRDRKALLLHAVTEGDAQVFQTIADVGGMIGDDAQELEVKVEAALAVCGPTYGRCNWMAWNEKLIAGAAASGSLRHALDACVDVSVGWGSYANERPEWFWGCPIGQLTDGHWMAFRAAREYSSRLRPR